MSPQVDCCFSSKNNQHCRRLIVAFVASIARRYCLLSQQAPSPKPLLSLQPSSPPMIVASVGLLTKIYCLLSQTPSPLAVLVSLPKLSIFLQPSLPLVNCCFLHCTHYCCKRCCCWTHQMIVVLWNFLSSLLPSSVCCKFSCSSCFDLAAIDARTCLISSATMQAEGACRDPLQLLRPHFAAISKPPIFRRLATVGLVDIIYTWLTIAMCALLASFIFDCCGREKKKEDLINCW